MDISQKHSGTIDLLLTDVVMPKFGGKELAQRIRAFRPETKIIYMSGYADGAVYHHGILESDQAFLQKPVSAKTLLNKIQEVLGE